MIVEVARIKLTIFFKCALKKQKELKKVKNGKKKWITKKKRNEKQNCLFKLVLIFSTLKDIRIICKTI